MTSPTIYALSSGAGRSGVAVVRLSGPGTRDIVKATSGTVPAPRHARLTSIRSTIDQHVIDRGLILFFPGPDSFTGEDLAEFHVHGSPAVIRAMLDEFALHAGTELATPGAFTERAFINGKLDLTEVEGLADLIDADTELQRQQALAQSSGILRRRSSEWRASLIHALALIEAVLDFSDEGDVTEGPINEAQASVVSLIEQLKAALADTDRAETIRTGLRIAIVGAPNVGKSSLLNVLAARDVAIVTPIAGTTRDTIEVQLELAGIPVTVIDTAGLRDTDDAIEREGISRARGVAAEADLVIHLMDATEPVGPEVGGPHLWRVLNKIDASPATSSMHPDAIAISAKDGTGIDTLLDALTTWCRTKVSSSEPAIVTRQRQRQCLEQCLSALQTFAASAIEDLELRAEDLRTAAVALGRLTGEIDAEDVLDDIFAGFCIGK